LASTRVVLDKQGVGDLLKSKEVGNYLLAIADKVANAAGSEYESRVDYTSRKSRVVAIALDPREEAKFVEMSTGKLARALGTVSE
jgi:hypothetical protein